LKVLEKIMLSLTLIFMILVVGFIALFRTAFLGLKFYAILVIVISFAFMLYVVLRVFGLLSGRIANGTPPKEDVVSGMGGIIAKTAEYRNHRNAIGFSFRFFAEEMVSNGNIRLLAIDGVYPTRETIADGTYHLASEFYAVTANTVNPNVERFIEWILSPQGQSLVEKTGYTPISS